MTDQDGTSGTAGYREIAESLRQQIEAGELRPGSKVPGENVLMARFGVEQPTARRALDLLKNEGLIFARRGSGTYVTEFRPIRRVSPDRLKDEVWGTGHSIWSADLDPQRKASPRDIQVQEEPVPEGIAQVLDLEGDTSVWVRRRCYYVEDRPVQLATSYYPASVVAGSAITEENTGDGGAYARLRELGHRPVRFREEVRVRMPNAAERGALKLTEGIPVAQITRTAYTSADRAIEVNEMVLDSNSYILEYKFNATD